MVGESVSEEIQNFLLEDQEILICNHGIDLDSVEVDDGDMELALPEDTFFLALRRLTKKEWWTLINKGKQGRKRPGSCSGYKTELQGGQIYKCDEESY
jgi:hypothetical protein